MARSGPPASSGLVGRARTSSCRRAGRSGSSSQISRGAAPEVGDGQLDALDERDAAAAAAAWAAPRPA